MIGKGRAARWPEPVADILGPLWRQPGIDVRQAQQLAAIAFSANVLDATYARLEGALADVEKVPGGREPVFADAWSIIDWADRLDGLVENCRGMPQHWPARVDYLNTSSQVDAQRNAIQHLEETIPHISGSSREPWGRLAWIAADPDDMVRSSLGMMAPPGRIPIRRRHEMRAPRWSVDSISLYSADESVEIGLTGQLEALWRFIPALEMAVATADRPVEGGILRIR